MKDEEHLELPWQVFGGCPVGLHKHLLLSLPWGSYTPVPGDTILKSCSCIRFPSAFLCSRRQVKLFRQCFPPEFFCITALEVNSSEFWNFLCFCLVVLIEDVLSKKEGEKHQLVMSTLSKSLSSCFSQGIWQHTVIYFSDLWDWSATSVIDLLFFIFFYFEALAMEPPARYPVLCKKALKSALNLHRKQAVIDAVKFRLVLPHSFAMSLWLEML